MINEEKTMKSDMIYEGKILNLRVDTVELPNKKYSKREIIDHSNAVGIIAITENDEMIMIQQYRKAVESVLLEIPAGLVELNEEPKETALRELKEETGYIAKQIEYVFDGYSSPGFTNEKLSFFVAKDFEKAMTDLDEDEFIDVQIIPIEDLLNKVESCEIVDTKTITAILYAARLVGK